MLLREGEADVMQHVRRRKGVAEEKFYGKAA